MGEVHDLKPVAGFAPFVGAGLGAIHGKLKTSEGELSDTVAGYQLTVGASYAVAPNLNLDLSDRYQAAAEDFSAEGSDASFENSNILFGVRYGF